MPNRRHVARPSHRFVAAEIRAGWHPIAAAALKLKNSYNKRFFPNFHGPFKAFPPCRNRGRTVRRIMKWKWYRFSLSKGQGMEFVCVCVCWFKKYSAPSLRPAAIAFRPGKNLHERSGNVTHISRTLVPGLVAGSERFEQIVFFPTTRVALAMVARCAECLSPASTTSTGTIRKFDFMSLSYKTRERDRKEGDRSENRLCVVQGFRFSTARCVLASSSSISSNKQKNTEQTDPTGDPERSKSAETNRREFGCTLLFLRAAGGIPASRDMPLRVLM